MSGNKIVVGDSVSVYFERAHTLYNLKVLAMPVATGDCWILEKEMSEKKEIFYVQNFAYMEKVSG